MVPDLWRRLEHDLAATVLGVATGRACCDTSAPAGAAYQSGSARRSQPSAHVSCNLHDKVAADRAPPAARVRSARSSWCVSEPQSSMPVRARSPSLGQRMLGFRGISTIITHTGGRRSCKSMIAGSSFRKVSSSPEPPACWRRASRRCAATPRRSARCAAPTATRTPSSTNASRSPGRAARRSPSGSSPMSRSGTSIHRPALASRPIPPIACRTSSTTPGGNTACGSGSGASPTCWTTPASRPRSR